jgi:hypothetical protein
VPVPIPRPAYLEHSALRGLLQTEAPTPVAGGHTQPSPGARPRRASSIEDSDDERSVSPGPPPPRSTSSRAAGPQANSGDVFKLPTRWCDEFRHHLLTLSPDGRELTYHGAFTLDFTALSYSWS